MWSCCGSERSCAGAGFGCLDSGRLEVRRAQSQDGVAYTIRIDTCQLGATDLQLLSSSTTEGKLGEASVEASYQVRCGSVGEGG